MNKKLLLLDIDDTILSSTAKIGILEPQVLKDTSRFHIENERRVSTSKFSEIRQHLHPDTKFDFTDFSTEWDVKKYYEGIRNINLIMNEEELNKRVLERYKDSIENAIPVFHMMDYIRENINLFDGVGILTARGGDPSVTHESLQKFFDINVYGIKAEMFDKDNVFCVSHSSVVNRFKIQNIALNTEHMKVKVIEDILIKEKGFTEIHFFDDDIKNYELTMKIDGVKPYLVTKYDIRTS